MDIYYTLVTDIPKEQFKAQIASNPLEAKMALARYLIAWLHNEEAAQAAQADWDRRRAGQSPVDMPTVAVGPGPWKLPALLVKAGLASSNSEAFRKIQEGAVQLNGEKVTDKSKEITIDKELTIKLGKKYVKVTP